MITVGSAYDRGRSVKLGDFLLGESLAGLTFRYEGAYSILYEENGEIIS